MYYLTIDCGTTNSRVYVVDETGKIYAKATKKVGVRNTSITGSRTCLEQGLREIVDKAIHESGFAPSQFKAILSSGMITSEIGLCELPHLMAPCDAELLSKSLEPVRNVRLTDYDIPVYFVRGIKNTMPEKIDNPFTAVGNCDFMRGEETQMVGLIDKGTRLPVTAVVLSSHTKFIPIDDNGMILGSLTTASGQLREAILAQTFVGKSVEKQTEEEPADYFDPAVIKAANDWINRGGLVRGMMFPRFLDVLLDTRWYERLLFFDTLIAAEDMLALNQLELLTNAPSRNFVLIGLEKRCRLYEHILKERISDASISSITDETEIDSLSINGILHIAKKAGIL